MLELPFDPTLDLRLERIVEVPRARVWQAWTEPELLMQWFTPAPWRTVECEIELRPGGVFRTVMQSPEGQQFPNLGCWLDVQPQQRLVWTDALLPGWRPSHRTPDGSCGLHGFFTGCIELFDAGPRRTRYVATALHRDPEDSARHQAMGFSEGWGAALQQLVALLRN